ncbi:MAG: (2Fe-2S) ferredoxin domain-containing protein [Crinalium sp.]
MSKHTEASTFTIEGRFLGFEIEDGYKLKRLRLGTTEGEQSIKLSKDLKARLKWDLPPGTWFKISGERKIDIKTGKLKLKASQITPVIPSNSETNRPTVVDLNAKVSAPAKTKAPILVCQKSDCMKRGGKAVCQALAESLRDRGLENQVAIKGTGCMKQCKAGPNIVMPDKTRYTRIGAEEIPDIIDKHFPDQTVSQPTAKIIQKSPEHNQQQVSSLVY